MNEEKEQERKQLLTDLEYYTRYYKEVSARSKQVKRFYDEEIKRIIKSLKELGK